MRKFIFFLICCLLTISVNAHATQPHEYNYYIGPWVWVQGDTENYWAAPEGTVGNVDFRSIEDMGTAETSSGYGFFAVDGELEAPYVLVASGYLVEAVVSDVAKDAIESALGYRPQTDTMLDVLWELVTTGSDVSGEIRAKPLMPDSKNQLQLWLGGHSLVRSESFVYGTHPHSEKVRSVIQNNYREIRKEEIKKNGEKHFEYLEKMKKQFNVDDAEKQFIPDDLPKDERSREK